MKRYDCKGWLKIHVDPINKKAVIKLTHSYHSKYVDIRVSEDIKEYIRDNLRQTPRVLWDYLGAHNEHLKEMQVYRWWMGFSEHSWKTKEDQVESAILLVNKYSNIEFMFKITQDGITAVAFAVKELLSLIGEKAVEIGIDATCK